MYERFYNLRERPFSLSPDPDYLFLSRVHTEALSYLRYGIEGHAGFVVITGEIGSGKTTLLQAAMRALDSRISLARLVNTMLDARELIEAIMLDFGLDPRPDQSKPHLLQDLAKFLVDQRTAGRLPLLIIDEAQNLCPAALEEVRMLSNLETEKSKLIQIILVGQPNLYDVLSRPQLEQLRQRITVRYHLRALDPDETSSYINHRLQRAALGAPLVFSKEVTDLIGQASHGLPRKINIIADAVLLFGYGEDKHTVDPPLVHEVIEELEANGVLAAGPAITVAAPAAPLEPLETHEARSTPGSIAVAEASAAVARASSEAALEAQRALAAREAKLAQGERALLERQRIVTEQYRLLKQEQALLAATTSPVAPWPPKRPSAAASRPTAAPDVFASSAGTVSFWTRMRRVVLGSEKPHLEDLIDSSPREFTNR
jgi:putative secretion ATPase (PEP-CTERM system associated)